MHQIYHFFFVKNALLNFWDKNLIIQRFRYFLNIAAQISVNIIPDIPICQGFTILFAICSQLEADEDKQVKLWEIHIPLYQTNQIGGYFYFTLLLWEMNLRLLELRRLHQKPCHLIKLQIASVITMSRQKIKVARKIKSKTLLKRKIKGLERENTVHPWIR